MQRRDYQQMKRSLRRFIYHPATELFFVVVIVLSVLLVLYEFSLEPVGVHYQNVVWVNDWLTYFFVVELLIRFWVEDNKRRFFEKFWVDVLAVIPVFRSFGFLRILRVLRLYRVGLGLYKAAVVFGVIRAVRAEYYIAGLVLFLVTIIGGMSLRVVEGGRGADFSTVENSMWFSVMTVIGGEPIGGEPSTTIGRVITTVLMMVGLTMFALITGTMSAVMVDFFNKVKERLSVMDINKIEDHLVICGWNRAGRLILEELGRDDRFRHVVVVTEDDSLKESGFFEPVEGRVHLLVGDFTRSEVLKEAGIERASFAMLLADSSKEERSSQDRDARTVLAAMLIEKLNQDIYTVVQLINRENETSLRQVGVEEIIVSDEYVGNIMATVAKNRGIVNMLDELLTSKYGHQFFKGAVPRSMIGRKVEDVIGELKRDHDATLIGVDLGVGGTITETMKVNPPGDLVLRESHQLIIAASKPLSME